MARESCGARGMSEGIEGKVAELDKKLDAIMKRLDVLEEMILLTGEYPYFASVIRGMRQSVAVYIEPIKILQRLVSVRKLLTGGVAIKDDLSQTILGVLAVSGPLNISQITEEVRAIRGKASRRIVRERLRRLEEHGTVRRTEGWGHRYEVVG
ncbi:MAG: hypothetical protein QXO94_05955 [Candidatus Bathyarchaeia archaeon]